MARPLQMYLFAHDAILRAVADYEARARDLPTGDHAGMAALADDLGFFREMARAHETAEEEVIFPALEGRHRYLAEPYLYDHDDFDERAFAEIDTALTQVLDADGDTDLGRLALYRACVALHEHMRLHIDKENHLLVTKLENLFEVEEQGEMAGAMAAVFDPTLMARTVAWMYRGQSLDDRTTMVTILAGILPPPAFEQLGQGLAAVDPDAWGALQARTPELWTAS